MTHPVDLVKQLQARLADQTLSITLSAIQEITIEVASEHAGAVAHILKNDPDFSFEQLVDLCGVDYLVYGCDEWETAEATHNGFERGREPIHPNTSTWTKPRFAVVAHLLSLQNNHRVRLRIFAEGDPPQVDSLVDYWASANWYEREAYDLFGIYFKGHPDLRRILTDYGFIGHPFRKDFPLSGRVEVIYDAGQGRVINQPVSIPERTLVPRVIREDARYAEDGRCAESEGGRHV
ncbi:MAG: NADH-quinone oxidoreductase subunit C [Pseudomonadota bacterium]